MLQKVSRSASYQFKVIRGRNSIRGHRIGFLVLLLHYCTGFNIIIPPSITAGVMTAFYWQWDTTDDNRGLSGELAALFINPPGLPENFSCLNLGAAEDQDASFVQSFAMGPVPSRVGASGSYLFTPVNEGPYFICLYG
ncbi:hypothetical protein L218DRAFT_1002652 [Marasmius fiardii PR-910]|nr:hypothetical protein L218DRAFT_1002652 [Marasmius fiardii PR-910]